jgi:tetratricopeptide (TPR) repeat protein
MYAAVTIMFFVADRFRAPVVPALSVFAGYAVAEIALMLRKRTYRRLIMPAAGVLAAAFLVNSDAYPVAPDDPARQEFVRGLIDLGSGQPGAAVERFRLVASMTRMPNLHANWGAALWQMGDTSGAVAEFQRELEVAPEAYAALSSLAWIDVAREDAGGAQAFAERTVRAHPRLPGGYVAGAQAFQLSHRGAAAESLLLRGRDAVRGRFLYGDYLLTGIRFGRSGNIDEADSSFRAIHKALDTPNQPLYEPEFEYGLESAAGVDDRTLRAYTEYKIAHVQVARSHLDSASLWFARSVATLPAFADAWADGGVTLLRLGRAAEAESCLVHATGLDPGRSLYWYNLGVARKAMHRIDAAAEAFRESLRLAPEFLPASEALERLAGGKAG